MMSYDANQFGGTQNDVGGGFMGSPGQGFGAGVGASPATRRTAPPSEGSLLPVTVKQIFSAPEPRPDTNLAIDGRELQHVSIVGNIESIEIQTTHTTYKVNDGTGTIDVKLWSTDDDIKQKTISQITDTSYVRVIGRVNVFKGVRSLTGFTIQIITDPNEKILHKYETLYAHELNTSQQTRLDFNNMGGVPATAHAGANMTTAHSNVGMGNVGSGMGMGMGMGMGPGVGVGGGFGMPMGRPQPAVGGGNNFSTGNGNADASPIGQRILQLMQQPQLANIEEGVSVEMIFSSLPDISPTDIRQAIEELANEGLLYSTIDDEHYKSTMQ